MKKYINYLLVIVITLFLFKYDCFASTNTYVRTNDNLRVPSDVKVDNDNYNDIIKTPSVSSSEKVYDFAEILSVEDEELLFENLSTYSKKTKYDAVIVTTSDLHEFDISDYAFNFYDYNDFKNEGVIFVIYTGEPEVSIYMANSGPTSSELFQIYNEKMIQSTLEYLYKNSISKQKYFEGCNNFIIIINEFYNRKASGNYEVDKNGNIVKTVPILEILIIAAASTFIIMVLLITSTKHKKKYAAEDIKDKLDKNTVVIRVDYDRAIDSSVK